MYVFTQPVQIQNQSDHQLMLFLVICFELFFLKNEIVTFHLPLEFQWAKFTIWISVS